MKHITTLSQKENKTMKTLLSATLLLSTFLLTACGGGGSSSNTVLPTVVPTVKPTQSGCYGVTNKTSYVSTGTPIFLSPLPCNEALAENPQLSHYEPLTNVGVQ